MKKKVNWPGKKPWETDIQKAIFRNTKCYGVCFIHFWKPECALTDLHNALADICCWAQSHERNHCKQKTGASLLLKAKLPWQTLGRDRRGVKLHFISQVSLSSRVRKAVPSCWGTETIQGSGWRKEEHELQQALFPITSDFSGPAASMTQMLTR